MLFTPAGLQERVQNKARQKQRLKEAMISGQHIIIDLDFTSQMTREQVCWQIGSSGQTLHLVSRYTLKALYDLSFVCIGHLKLFSSQFSDYHHCSSRYFIAIKTDICLWQVISLCQQLSFCHSINAAADTPVHLEFTGMAGGVGKALKAQVSGVENWPVTMTDGPYIEKFENSKSHLVSDQMKGSHCFAASYHKHNVMSYLVNLFFCTDNKLGV